MDTETKSRFDAIAALWKGAWEQFNERRKFEFQISLAVWTALASFTALVISNEKVTFEKDVRTGTIICIVLICIIYVIWTLGLTRSNAYDKKIAIHYAKILRQLSSSQFDAELENLLKKNQKSLTRFWSQASQIGVTLVLAIAAILSVFSKIHPPSS